MKSITFVFPANGKNPTFAVCRFYMKVSTFAFVINMWIVFDFIANLLNDSRKNKDNQLQADVCRRTRCLTSNEKIEGFQKTSTTIHVKARLFPWRYSWLLIECRTKTTGWGGGGTLIYTRYGLCRCTVFKQFTPVQPDPKASLTFLTSKLFGSVVHVIIRETARRVST